MFAIASLYTLNTLFSDSVGSSSDELSELFARHFPRDHMGSSRWLSGAGVKMQPSMTEIASSLAFLKFKTKGINQSTNQRKKKRKSKLDTH